MKFFQKFIGYMLAGLLVMSSWDGLVDSYGILGGVAAATLIIFPTWAINHYRNLVGNDEKAAFVDQGLAIAFAGIFRDFFLFQESGQMIDTLPTLIVIVLGAVAGGYVAGKFELAMENKGE